MRLTTVIAPIVLFPLIAACQPGTHRVQPDKQPAVETLYAGQQCGRSQAKPSVTWIDNAQQLKTSIKQIQRTLSGGKPIPLSELDFQHEIVLLVEMGQRPTLGYQIALPESNNLRSTQSQLHLTLNWIQPPADAMVAQMISSPCLLLKLKRGNYTSIQILDKQGTIKAGT